MSEKEKKKQIAKISVFITSLFVIFLSVTYAFINMTLVGTRRQVITAGNLELELLEDENNLTIQDAMPMYDEVGMIQDAFTFRLKNKITTDTNYILRLVDITTGERLDTSIVKYGLTKDGASTIKLLSTLKNGEIDKGKISGNQTINYSLRLWIDSSVEENTVISGKSLSYRIDVEVSQDIEKPVYAMMKRRDSYNSTEAFWGYSDSITSVVFENKIQVPSEIEENKKWDISEEQNGSVMAYLEEDGVCIVNDQEVGAYKLHIQGERGIAANKDSRSLFDLFINLKIIEGLKFFDTSNVTSMYAMFSECRSLTSLDVSNFDTSNTTSMFSMFFGCSSLTSLDLDNFDTSKVVDMHYMFYDCRSLTNLDLSKFDTSNVINMHYMFCRCSNLTSLDISNFDTSNVTNLSNMFDNCNSLTSLDISNFDTSNIANMSSMFSNCRSLTSLDLSSFDTTNVTDMSSMFFRCIGLTSLDLSHFDTSNVTNMEGMFSICSELTSLDLSSFDISKVTSKTYMFDSVKNDCLITVKDEAMKAWILEQNNKLINVVIQNI